MNAWEQLIGNRILMSAVTGWFVAQLLKTIIHTHGHSVRASVRP